MTQWTAIVLDMNQTLVDSSSALELRRQRRWQEVYRSIAGFRVYDGVAELLAVVEDRGLRTAIVTSSPSKYTKLVLTHFSIRCDALVCYHDTRRHKPHPDPIELAVQKLAVAPEAILSVGDDAKDIVAGRSAGVATAAAAWGTLSVAPLRDARAEHWCNTVGELVDLLRC